MSSKKIPLEKMILNELKGLQYGSLMIVVHDGQIVQIERTEKKRFDLLKNDASRKDDS